MTTSTSSNSSSTFAATISLAAATVVAVSGTVYWLQQQQRKNNQKTPPLNKDHILQQRRAHFSKSLSVSYSNSDPLLILEGHGAQLIDHQGVAYLDTRNNVAHVGHAHPHVAAAVAQQVARLNTNTRYLHPNITTLAERLLATMPSSSTHKFDQVFFCNSGSEVNDLALRLARAWADGCKNTLVVDGAYHGHTLATLELSPHNTITSSSSSSSSSKPEVVSHQEEDPSTGNDYYEEEHKFEHSPQYDNHKGSEVASSGSHIFQVPCPDVYQGRYRDPTTAAAQYVQTVQDACDHFASRGEQVAALICESALGVGGAVLPPPGYLAAAAQIVRASGGLWIADEVQTGFGRAGESFWMFEYTARDDRKAVVMPDIVTVGKPFGNGMPLSAVITSRRITRKFEASGVEYFNTFGGNPVSAAAGLAVLDVLEDEQLQARALKVGTYLKQKFVALQQKCDWIGDVRGVGLFLGVELVHDRTTRRPAPNITSWLSSVLKSDYQILTSIDGLAMNVLVIKPPMVFSTEDADYFVDSVQSALLEDLPRALQEGAVEAAAKTPT